MKYFFYPKRRFVTFAPIMNNNSKSPVSDLQYQQLLLRMEYEYEKEEFKRQTETMGIARKVKRGLCWYPVSPGRSYYNSLNQLVIDITRTENKEIEHSFEFGRPVCFPPVFRWKSEIYEFYCYRQLRRRRKNSSGFTWCRGSYRVTSGQFIRYTTLF